MGVTVDRDLFDSFVKLQQLERQVFFFLQIYEHHGGMLMRVDIGTPKNAIDSHVGIL